MSYYILPKKYSELTIDPTVSIETPQCVISSSLLYYINEVNDQITNYDKFHKFNVFPTSQFPMIPLERAEAAGAGERWNSGDDSRRSSLQIDNNFNNEYTKNPKPIIPNSLKISI